MIFIKQGVDMDVHPFLLAGLAYLGFKSDYDWKVTSARRNNQAAIYAQGRTMPGVVVTDATAGTSPHEFGLAIDAYPTVDKGATIILDIAHPAFAERDSLLRSNGFLNSHLQTDIVISSGPDVPHMQIRDWQKNKEWHTQLIALAAVTAIVSLFLASR